MNYTGRAILIRLIGYCEYFWLTLLGQWFSQRLLRIWDVKPCYSIWTKYWKFIQQNLVLLFKRIRSIIQFLFFFFLKCTQVLSNLCLFRLCSKDPYQWSDFSKSHKPFSAGIIQKWNSVPKDLYSMRGKIFLISTMSQKWLKGKSFLQKRNWGLLSYIDTKRWKYLLVYYFFKYMCFWLILLFVPSYSFLMGILIYLFLFYLKCRERGRDI